VVRHTRVLSAEELPGSDVLGRTAAFNGTLVLTAVFGVSAAFAPSFPLLCLALLFLGTAVGVSFLVQLSYDTMPIIHLVGINAYGRDTASRERPEEQAVSCDSSLSLLLYRCSPSRGGRSGRCTSQLLPAGARHV
jgi:hypothetical protein